MCGITGIWNLNSQPLDWRRLHAATQRIRHRGPDDEGYLLIDSRAARAVACGGPDTPAELGLPRLSDADAAQADLGLGFRRLAILDLSPAGHQPMATPDGQCWIVFNGEIYNYLVLRAELQAAGYSFRSGSDTEVILAAYQHWGDACLERLNGMWAFAIWDARRRRLLLARDRFGIKPLYYVHQPDRFAFASEIKGLVGPVVPFQPDQYAIFRYLLSGTLVDTARGQTFFQGVRSLPPAHAMVVERDRITTWRYWALPAPTDSFVPAEAAVERMGELFTESVRWQLQSDVPVGTCLSGGVDSSSIVCTVNQLMRAGGVPTDQLGAFQKTFSAVYASEGRHNERTHIDRVLRATQAQGHFTYPTAEGLVADLGRLVWHQDEPFQGTSIFAQWCVMRLVREQGVTVLLDGQGADESLAGYRPFAPFLADLTRAGQARRALVEMLLIRERTGVNPLGLVSLALGSLLPNHFALPLRYLRAAPFALSDALNAGFRGSMPDERDADWYSWESVNNLQGVLRSQLADTSLPHLLRYEDRNSMAFGIEARVPFLDHRIVEFALGAARPWLIQQGWTKWVLRRAMETRVPDAVIWRSDKVGFETPERDWTIALLNAGLAEFTGQSHVAAYLDLNRARSYITNWRAQGGDARAIWRWMNLEQWFDVWQRSLNSEPALFPIAI